MPNDPSAIPPQNPPAQGTPPPPMGATPPPPAGQPPYNPQAAPPAQAPYQQAPYQQPQQAYAGAPSKDDNTMALLVHVSAIFTGFVGPLIIWLIKKDESPFVDRHGKTALNFQFTLLIGYVVSMILFLVLIGILTFLACLVMGLVFPIIAAIAANKGQEYTYPLSIKFFK